MYLFWECVKKTLSYDTKLDESFIPYVIPFAVVVKHNYLIVLKNNVIKSAISTVCIVQKSLNK